MAIELPAPIAAYFAADRGRDADVVSRCFTENAIVRDEGKSHIGRHAIERWKAEASTAYTYTVEPISVTSEDGTTVVTSHVAGSFPGSPVDLRYLFVLDGEQIAELEIVL